MVAVIRASLGGFDRPVKDEPQSVECRFITYTDGNFPPRRNSMAPRLQAKIPKMFGWQLNPGYGTYMWLDGNIRLAHKDSVKYFQDHLKDHDIVVLHHPDRNTIWWEYRYNWRGLYNNKPSRYLLERYTGEWLDEQMKVIKDDKDYKDDYLVNGGIFMYRDTPEVRKMFWEWWYHVSRYLIMDQMSWAYVLKKSGLKVKVLPDNYRESKYLEQVRHKIHG